MERARLSIERPRLPTLAGEHLDPEVMRYLAHGPSSREITERAHRDRLEQAQHARDEAVGRIHR